MEGTECGAASLAMVMAYYGKYVPLDKLRVDTGVSRDGCRAAKSCRVPEKHGFETEGLPNGPRGIAERRPSALHHTLELQPFLSCLRASRANMRI